MSTLQQWYDYTPDGGITFPNRTATISPADLLRVGDKVAMAGTPYALVGNRRTSARFKFFPFPGNISGAVSGTTTQRFRIPRVFSGFTIEIASGDNSVVKMSYAISSNPNSDGSDLTWSSIYVSGSTSITRTGVTPIVSDLNAYNSYGNSDIYLYTRVAPVSGTYGYVDAGHGSAAASGGFAEFGLDAPAWSLTVGDIVSGGAGSALGYNNWMQCITIGATFYGTELITIASIGDSLDQGWSVNGESANYRYTIRHAGKLLRDEGFGVGDYNLAKAGETHAVSVISKLPLLFSDPLGVPTFVTMRPWSPNDGSTTAWFQKGITETVFAINYALSRGATPIIATATPCGATGEKESARQQVNQWVRSLIHGCPIADIDSVVRDPGAQASIRAEYLDSTGNSTHFNSAGYQAIGAKYYSVVKSLLQ